MNHNQTDLSPQRYLLHNVAISFVGLFINQSVATIGMGIVARTVPNKTLFGEINLLLQIIGIAGVFLNLGLNSSITYLASRHGRKVMAPLFGMAALASVGIGFALAALLGAFASVLAQGYGHPHLAPAILICTLTLLLYSLVNIGVAAFSGMRRFSAQMTFMVLSNIFSTTAIVIGAVVGHGQPRTLWWTALCIVIADALTAIIVLWRARRDYHVRLLLWPRRRLMLRMIRYGVPMWAGNIAKSCQQSYLVIVMGTVSLVASGYLSNGLKIAGFLNIVTWAFNIVALPFLSKVIHQPREASHRATLCFRYNNYILFPLTLMTCLFARPITEFAFGTTYTNSQSVLYVILLSLGILSSSIPRLGGTMLAGLGRTRANFWTMVISGVPLYLLVPFFASDGRWIAPFIYLLGWSVAAVALFWYLRHDGLPLQWRRAFVDPLIPALASSIPFALAAWTTDLTLRWSLVFLGLGLLVLVTWMLEHSSKRHQYA
ncbi:MAG: oligosaccharide flippase family protein [Alicyclobacillaceae bacterium]|nr:oligosaccharide flippase family protein [Alicyclobacillaceae bacterium]